MQSMPLLTIQKIAGLLACALGLTVLTGWLIGSHTMVRIVPGSVAMAVNTAAMFLASGLCLLRWHPARPIPAGVRLAAMALVMLSTLILLEHLFDVDFGIDLAAFHARFGDKLGRPGRTSPNATLCFLLVGIVFLLNDRMQAQTRMTNVVNALVCVVTAIGLTGLLGYVLNLEAMYKIASYNRMAASTAIGLSVLGTGMWCAIHAARPRAADDFRHEDKRVMRLAATLLTVFAVAGGVAGFAVLSHGFEQAARDDLRQDAARNAFFVSEAIDHAQSHAQLLTANTALAAQLAMLNDTAADQRTLATVIDTGNRLLPLGVERVGFFNARGELLAWAGNTRTDPSPVLLSLALADGINTLYWQNGFRLRTNATLMHAGRAAGSIVVENRLPTLDALLNELNSIGASQAMLLCGRRNGAAACFPSRFNRDNPHVSLRAKEADATDAIMRALLGRHGAGIFQDMRGVDVVAGYAPLATLGLATVAKIDVSELYAPMRDKLNLLAAVLALFVIIGTRLLHRLVQPLVSRILAEQQRMQVILRHTSDAFVALDEAGRITDWNERAEKTFGWSSQEARGRELTELIIPAQQRAAARALLRDARAGAGERIELMTHDRFDRPIPVEMSIGSFRDGRHPLLSAFLRDISERKKAERQAAEHEQSMDRARAALLQSQKLEAIGKLTGGVAHDFNNVLQVISGSLQLLQVDLAGNERARKRIATASGAVERGAKLSSELLTFARRQPLQSVPTDLGRVVRSIDDMLQRALGEAIEIVIATPDALWNALVDPHQIEHVILNLAINARDAMDGAGKLTIELDNVRIDPDQERYEPGLGAGDYVTVALTDTGCGMSPETLERVFEPFFTTKPEGQGTGLGLSMAYGFVKQSGGHIRIQSAPGRGTTVRLYLPRSDDAETHAPKASDAAPLGGTETILVVEDDHAVRATAVDILHELGYRVLHANNGEQALEIIRGDADIDLLFTDVVMPGNIRSRELAAQAAKLRPGIAILFASGYTQDAFADGPPAKAGIHLLHKPYRHEDLARKIRELLDRRPPAETASRAVPEAVPAPPAAPERAEEHGIRILVVEDNDDFRDLICELIGLLGHRADRVSTAEDALAAIGARRYDILLTDVNLPGLSGIALAERYKAASPQGRVIFSSGVESERSPAADAHTQVLRKPYGFEELKAAIARLMAPENDA